MAVDGIKGGSLDNLNQQAGTAGRVRINDDASGQSQAAAGVDTVAAGLGSFRTEEDKKNIAERVRNGTYFVKTEELLNSLILSPR